MEVSTGHYKVNVSSLDVKFKDFSTIFQDLFDKNQGPPVPIKLFYSVYYPARNLQDLLLRKNQASIYVLHRRYYVWL